MVQNRDIRALTGIRGIAALVVLLYHVQYGLEISHDSGLWRFGSGYLAVDLFFVLSGFVMSLNYGPRFADAVSRADYASFIGRRVKRLFPLYWLVCGIAVAKASFNYSGTDPIDLSLDNVAENLSMVHGWGFEAERFIVPSWSVSTELVAYIVFPLAVLGSGSFRRWPIAAAAALGLLLMVEHSGLGEAGPMDVFQAGSFYPLLRCLAGFGLGMAAQASSRSRWARRYLSGDAALLALLAGVAVCTAYRADVALIGVVFPMLVVNLALNRNLAERLFANEPVHYLGLISYSIYLVHPLLLGSCLRVAHIVGARGAVSAELVAPALTAAATIAVSALTYRYVERGRWVGTASRALVGLRRSLSGRERPV